MKKILPFVKKTPFLALSVNCAIATAFALASCAVLLAEAPSDVAHWSVINFILCFIGLLYLLPATTALVAGFGANAAGLYAAPAALMGFNGVANSASLLGAIACTIISLLWVAGCITFGANAEVILAREGKYASIKKGWSAAMIGCEVMIIVTTMLIRPSPWLILGAGVVGALPLLALGYLGRTRALIPATTEATTA